MPPARALPRIAALAALTALLMTGCALAPPTDVTDHEARDRFIALVDEAEQAAGGRWQVQDDPSPRECQIPLWVTGSRVPALRTGPAPVDGVAATAERMREHFEGAGMTVSVSDVADVVEVRAGLEEGEHVIVENQEQFRPGRRVRVELVN